MTRRERIERRIERRREWAESRRTKAASAFRTAESMLSVIPPGQPILVGHHSERRHRRDLARIDSAMRRGCESTDMARHHDSTAANLESAIDRSIYSDDANAIEALRARIAEREAEAERIVALNKAIRRELKAGLTLGWLDRIGATETERKAIDRNVRFDWRHQPMFPAYTLSNLRGRITADKQRLEAIERRTQRQQQAESNGGIAIFTAGDYCSITFAEKPDRSILNDLKAAGFSWGNGQWNGYVARIPESVKAMTEAA